MIFGSIDFNFLRTCRYVILTAVTRDNLEVFRVTDVYYILGIYFLYFRDKNDEVDSSRLKVI